MPNISNEAVVGSGYVTYRNARPQLLSNGWIVAAVYSSSATRLQFRVKKTPAGAWEDLAFLTTSNVLSWSIQVKGTRVFSTLHTSSSSATSFLNFDATTVSSSATLSASAIDSTSTSGGFSGEDLIINDAGTELHHAFSAKTPALTNSFNIRYLKGVIAADSSVSWGAVEQVTKNNNQAGQAIQNPSINLFNGVPLVLAETNQIRFNDTGTGVSNGFYSVIVIKRSNQLTSYNTYFDSNWSYKNLSSDSNYEQKTPNGLFIPQSINGLSNGRLWNGWHGKDATDTAKFNVRTTFSDDGGVTWATPTKQTTGNLYDQTNASLTADKTGKVLLYWDGDEDASGNTVTVTKEKIYTGTWGTTTSLSGDNHYGVTTLFDRSFSLGMTRAPLIRYYASGVRFTGNYFAPPSIFPQSSALGDKTASSVLSYTVTPDSGSTITSIVEKVNGTTVNTYSNPASLSRTFTIPLANWDALKYYNTHTISVTVTDSNGMANTQTYNFNKALANDASLLEGTKAAKDGKDRISTKRDALATQVGLPAGSTFDAISAAITSNLFKMATGSTNSSTSSPYDITVTGLVFRPKVVIFHIGNFQQVGVWVDPTMTGSTNNKYVAYASTLSDNSSSFGADFRAFISSNGFKFATNISTTEPWKWIAFG